MPVNTAWHDEQNTVVWIGISDPWTMNDLSSGIRSSRELMASVEHTVDAIWDGSQTKGAPSNMLSHFMLPNDDTIISDNQGAVLVVVNSLFLKQFVMIAKKLLPQVTKNMHITTSLSDAEKKLETLRRKRE